MRVLFNVDISLISIHAAREGGDFRVREYYAFPDEISIHAAREGGDVSSRLISYDVIAFQSTPPVKAATCKRQGYRLSRRISIHAAREGGDSQGRANQTNRLISIHAAREGGDSGNE